MKFQRRISRRKWRGTTSGTACKTCVVHQVSSEPRGNQSLIGADRQRRLRLEPCPHPNWPVPPVTARKAAPTVRVNEQQTRVGIVPTQWKQCRGTKISRKSELDQTDGNVETVAGEPRGKGHTRYSLINPSNNGTGLGGKRGDGSGELYPSHTTVIRLLNNSSATAVLGRCEYEHPDF